MKTLIKTLIQEFFATLIFSFACSAIHIIFLCSSLYGWKMKSNIFYPERFMNMVIMILDQQLNTAQPHLLLKSKTTEV